MNKFNAMKIEVGLVLLLAVAGNGLAQTTNYVVEPGKETGVPTSPYTNWGTAATNIYDAVNDANAGLANVVVVSNGHYYLTSQIAVTNGIHVRSWNNGMIDRENTIVDGNHSVQCFLTSNSAILEGLTITNGFGSSLSGGGVYMSGGTVTNCIITGNIVTNASGAGILAGRGNNNNIIANSIIYGNQITNSSGKAGGGIYIITVYPLITRVTDCVISNNSATNCQGGAIMIYAQEAVISKCDIVDNKANGGNGRGGGIYLTADSSANISDCLIARNTVGGYGGGGILHYASTISGTSTILVERCTISGNASTAPGGGLKQQNASSSNLVLRSCLIISNSATIGGGLALYSPKNTRVENCTVAYNTATTSGEAGGVTIGVDGVTLFNTIVYYNSASGGYPDVKVVSGANTSVNYSCVRYSDGIWDGVTNGINNITNAPLFVGTNAGNYRLTANSPGINTGLNQDWMTGALDLDGYSRIDKFSRRVDMGCYEYIPKGTMFRFH